MIWVKSILFFSLMWPPPVSSVPPKFLPANLRPQSYDVYLAYDLKRYNGFPFFGLVKIMIKVINPTNKIVLHAQGYTTDNERIMLQGPNLPNIADVEIENRTSNFLIINLDGDLTQNVNYTLSIPFSGDQFNQTDGVYISTYFDIRTNTTETMLSTHFEAASARKAFPCFDEPLYKAVFTMNIGHSNEYTAISNMPLASSTTENVIERTWSYKVMKKTIGIDQRDFVWDQFEQSLPMSTYLVAFVISKLVYMETTSKKTKFKFWAKPGAIKHAAYAATIAPKFLEFYEDLFGLPYPLPKADLVAVPDAVKTVPAMENWGLITFRENLLLYDYNESSATDKVNICQAVSHELAHQWFGSLVTIKRWSSLWLAESFAASVSTSGVRRVEPAWRYQEHIASENMRRVLAADALQSSHPVAVDIDDPRRLLEVVDEISMKKGSLLIRMLVQFLGESVFSHGIKNFLARYYFSNIDEEDLWNELTSVAVTHSALSRNVTVTDIMDTWVRQTGYPLVTVTRNLNDGSFMVSQKRYLESDQEVEPEIYSWWVPLNVLTERDAIENMNRQQQVQWLSNQEGTTSEKRFGAGLRKTEWLLVNSHMFAPYRVNYDEVNWELLVRALNSGSFTRIPLLSRSQLIDDAFALAENRILDYGTAIDILNYLEMEKDYFPLHTASIVFRQLERRLRRVLEYGVFQQFVRKMYKPAYESSGGIYESRFETNLMVIKLRTLTSEIACMMGERVCVQKAMSLFRTWMTSLSPDESNPIPADLRPTVYYVAISHGSTDEWRFLNERRLNSNCTASRLEMMHGLRHSRDIWILKQMLEWIITEPFSVEGNVHTMIKLIMDTQVGYYAAKDFIMERVDDIHNASLHLSTVPTAVRLMLEHVTTKAELTEYFEWSKKHPHYLEESSAVDRGLDVARANIEWMSRNKQLIFEKLQAVLDPNFIYHHQINFTKYSNANSRQLLDIRLLIYILIFGKIF